MNYEEGVKKIKYALAQLGYNVLGYEYSTDGLKEINPWFYPKDEEKGFPPEVDEFFEKIQKKYVIAAKRSFVKKLEMREYHDTLCCIKGDGLSFEEIQLQYIDMKNTFSNIIKRKDSPFPKKTVRQYKGILMKRPYGSITIGLIYENGLDMELVEKLENYKNLKRPIRYLYRAFYFDLANEGITGGIDDFNTSIPKTYELYDLIYK